MAFKMKSGNSPMFKMIGSSPLMMGASAFKVPGEKEGKEGFVVADVTTTEGTFGEWEPNPNWDGKPDYPGKDPSIKKQRRKRTDVTKTIYEKEPKTDSDSTEDDPNRERISHRDYFEKNWGPGTKFPTFESYMSYIKGEIDPEVKEEDVYEYKGDPPPEDPPCPPEEINKIKQRCESRDMIFDPDLGECGDCVKKVYEEEEEYSKEKSRRPGDRKIDLPDIDLPKISLRRKHKQGKGYFLGKTANEWKNWKTNLKRKFKKINTCLMAEDGTQYCEPPDEQQMV